MSTFKNNYKKTSKNNGRHLNRLDYNQHKTNKRIKNNASKAKRKRKKSKRKIKKIKNKKKII